MTINFLINKKSNESIDNEPNNGTNDHGHRRGSNHRTV